MSALLPVIIGFLLTTVLGGLLATYLQRQSWSHQFRAQAAAQDIDRATQVFEEVSRLLDRRLYRMRRLYWALCADVDSPPRADAQARMDDYVAVLYEWNDGINRNLALLERYFGSAARDGLDYEIGGQVRGLGVSLEEIWRSLSNQTVQPGDQGGRAPTTVSNLNPGFDGLANSIYAYNVDLLRAIQSGDVGGRRKPNEGTSAD
jgi:hypothetical protein